VYLEFKAADGGGAENLPIRSPANRHSNVKMRFQSSFILMTGQPFFFAWS
jgi:hypothetical protein